MNVATMGVTQEQAYSALREYKQHLDRHTARPLPTKAHRQGRVGGMRCLGFDGRRDVRDEGARSRPGFC